MSEGAPPEADEHEDGPPEDADEEAIRKRRDELVKQAIGPAPLPRGPDPGPCLSMYVPPHPCLSPPPQTCLSVAPQVCLSPAWPERERPRPPRLRRTMLIAFGLGLLIGLSLALAILFLRG